MKKTALIFVMALFVMGATGLNTTIASQIVEDAQYSLVNPDKDPKKEKDKKCCNSEAKSSCADKSGTAKSGCCSSKDAKSGAKADGKCCDSKEKAAAGATGEGVQAEKSGKCCSSAGKK